MTYELNGIAYQGRLFRFVTILLSFLCIYIDIFVFLYYFLFVLPNLKWTNKNLCAMI